MIYTLTHGDGRQEAVDLAPANVIIPIRYFDHSLPELCLIGGKSDWIDLYSRVGMFILEGASAMIPLNVAMELPEGWEAYVAPRSSLFKNWGLLKTNAQSIIDESFCGNTDEWNLPVYCVPGQGKGWAYKDKDGLQSIKSPDEAPEGVAVLKGTWIFPGDRLCQFRIQEHMPPINFKPTSHLEGKDRGGFGTTGKC